MGLDWRNSTTPTNTTRSVSCCSPPWPRVVNGQWRDRNVPSHWEQGVVLPRFHSLLSLAMEIMVGPKEGAYSRGRDAGCPAPPAQIRACPLRHTAPTSGGDGGSRLPPYPTPACVTDNPALCPVRTLVGRIPLGSTPSLHGLRREFPLLVRPLHHYYGCIRLLPPSPRGVRVSPFPQGPGSRRGRSKPSQVPTPDVRTCMGSLTPRSPAGPHPFGPAGIAFDRVYSLGTSDQGAFDAQ